MLNVYLFIVQRGFLGMSHGQCVLCGVQTQCNSEFTMQSPASSRTFSFSPTAKILEN